ncbi:MAG: transcription-repair coupling factor [Oscillospiraceae bacterium]|nr:transcription-repair coupling factor [Oscillospiraceae bacterium]
MELILQALQNMEEYRLLLSLTRQGKAVGVSGVSRLPQSHFSAALFRDLGRPALFVVQDELAAQRLQEDLSALTGEELPILPGRELSFYDSSALSHGWEQKRIAALYAFGTGKTRALIAPVEALSLRTMPPDALLRAAVTLTAGEKYPLDALTRKLTDAGYRRAALVEGPGQFSLRGDILDVYSPGEDRPVRAEFFDETLDCMGFFDPLTQRRTENADTALLLPVSEAQFALHPDGREGFLAALRSLYARQQRRKYPNEAFLKTLAADLERLENDVSLTAADRYLSVAYPVFSCAADYLPAGALVLLCDYGNLARAARLRQETLGEELTGFLESGLLVSELCELYAEQEDLFARFAGHPAVFFDSFLPARYPESLPPKELISVLCKQLPSYGGSLDAAADDAKHYCETNYATMILCGNRRRAEILRELLESRGLSPVISCPAEALPHSGQLLLTDGSLPAGLEYPALQLAILSEGQLFAPKSASPKKRAKRQGQKLRAFTDLAPGDYVVHEQHGIGKFVGMEQIRVDGVVKDFIRIAYQGDDTLFIPATQLDLISKYVGGGEESTVRLSKLGGEQWKKTKARAKSAAKELAGELIRLYAARRRCPGFPFSADTPWQREFEDAFPYAETEDQLRCVEEIKKDMESPVPMDRLLCGDVGFGKTEVALRAAMKAILDGKQVAILVPTTVLAQQHYVTAVGRFRGYPVNIEVLSRFRSPAQLRKTLEGLEEGSVDLVIGTHKLLQKTVKFKALGLLIVDEEQRFGVTHKERLKEMSHGVDVLTLSATPIPRTLNMALSGLRDMSTIEEPPRDRHPVQTYVMEYAEPVLDEAMRRELARGGQIYYLHNRTESIEECAAAIRRRLGGVAVAVAHGKMHEDELSDVMQRVVDGEVRVLVCTTIIETGVDIPNVNTLIIEDADRFGLAQLHQLRGRIGRSSRHAFAYLTFRRGKVLSEVAEKRLGAIREFAEFNSGFRIAMRDLEIRGAGDLLGAEQSGHILSVGYDMYLKLLEDAVLEEKGEERPKEPDCTVDLTVTANLEQGYVSSQEQRMDLYRRMAMIRTQQDADEMLDEIVDRFGDPPKGVLNLIDAALLRAEAARAGICEVKQRESVILLTPYAADLEAVSAACGDPSMRGKLLFSAGKTPLLTARLAKGEDPLRLARAVVRVYAAHLPNRAEP